MLIVADTDTRAYVLVQCAAKMLISYIVLRDVFDELPSL